MDYFKYVLSMPKTLKKYIYMEGSLLVSHIFQLSMRKKSHSWNQENYVVSQFGWVGEVVLGQKSMYHFWPNISFWAVPYYYISFSCSYSLPLTQSLTQPFTQLLHSHALTHTLSHAHSHTLTVHSLTHSLSYISQSRTEIRSHPIADSHSQFSLK